MSELRETRCHWCRENLTADQVLVTDGRVYKTCGACFRQMLKDFGKPRRSHIHGLTVYWWPRSDHGKVGVSRRVIESLSLEEEWELSRVRLY